MPRPQHFIFKYKIEIFLVIAVLCNVACWCNLRFVRAHWGNVPPAPRAEFAASSGLGDVSFSYRIIGLMLQNLGDSGGRSTALKDYDFEELAKWFYIQQKLDAHSNYTPYLAAYYFSASQDPEKIRPLIGYLAKVGVSQEKQKWRYLAQAVYLARFVIKDTTLALELANQLAAHTNKDLPLWTKNMPAFVMNQQGDKKAAYTFLAEVLRSNMKTMSPVEVINMRYYICDQVLAFEDAKTDPLCKDIPLKNK